MGWRGSGLFLDDEQFTAYQYLLDWSIKQLEPLEHYSLMGNVITSNYEITFFNRQFIGTAPFEAGPPKYYSINLVVRDKTGGERVTPKTFYEKDLPSDINDILSIIDDLIWLKIRDDISSLLQLSVKDLPQYLTKHVFIAYRDTNINSKKIAEKLSKYLEEEKGLPVWYFPWEARLGDSVTSIEEKAITDSFGAVLCFTSDFLEGKTAKEEFDALIARRRYHKLRVIPVFINLSHQSIPSFLLDSFSVKFNSPEDEDFNKKADMISRSLLELPIES